MSSHPDGNMAKSAGTVTVDADEETQKTTIRLPLRVYNQLCHAAVDERRDQQDIVADALVKYFESRKKSRMTKQ